MLLFLLACAADPTVDPYVPPGPDDLPAPEDLPALAGPPDALRTWEDDLPVTSVAAWEARRRPEILALFAHYEHGWSPPPVAATARARAEAPALDGAADLLQIDADVAGVPFRLYVFFPAGAEGPVPVVLGLNKCGAASIRAELPPTDAFVDPTCPPEPGGRASYWDLDAALAAGVAVATVHQSEFAPDDPDLPSPLRDALVVDVAERHAWAAVAAWAWGLSRAVDLLEEDPRVGPVVLFGHSRRGKAALWAGAGDPRVAAVWAHQSGTGGQTLSRSYNGEPVAAMNLLFPHWFPESFHTFGEREDFLPFDQHLLLALIAPRPLLVTDGDEDLWADPAGADAAVALAAPVSALYGVPPPARRIRPGGHEVTGGDWAILLDWMAGWTRAPEPL